MLVMRFSCSVLVEGLHLRFQLSRSSMENPILYELENALRTGNREQYNALILPAAQRLAQLNRRRFHNEVEEDELVQETATRLWRRWDALRAAVLKSADKSFRAYFHQLLQNCFLDLVRRKRFQLFSQRPTTGTEEDEQSRFEGTIGDRHAPPLTVAENREYALAGIARLNVKERVVLKLDMVCEQSEIARLDDHEGAWHPAPGTRCAAEVETRIRDKKKQNPGYDFTNQWLAEAFGPPISAQTYYAWRSRARTKLAEILANDRRKE